IDVVEVPFIPFLYPERLLHSGRRSGVGQYATTTKGPRIRRERWLAVTARVQREELRAVAGDFRVSRAPVRSVVPAIVVEEHVS
ncbi:MAG: hypothetical protein KY456_12645, partial [Chloroflexi bacterium]|nr:hypothetical protein [Chloroflexota bacterium]